MRANLIQTNFTAGEVSPQMYGRVDVNKYANGCGTLKNFLVRPQGGITRRSGTQYLTTAKISTYIRLIDFKVSNTLAYVLEFGNQYIRFMTGGALVRDGSGNPVVVTTPYLSSELDQLYVAESVDVMYIAHPNHPPQILTRLSNTSWTLAQYVPEDGPYLEKDTSGNKAQVVVSSDITTLVANISNLTTVQVTCTNNMFSSGNVGEYIPNTGSTVNPLILVTTYVSTSTLTGTLIASNLIINNSGGTITYSGGLGQLVSSQLFGQFSAASVGSYVQVGSTWYLISAFVDAYHATAAAITMVNLTLAGTVTITGPSLFSAGSVGQYVEYLQNGEYLLAQILTYVDPTTVKVRVLPNVMVNDGTFNVSIPTGTPGNTVAVSSSYAGVFGQNNVGMYVRDTSQQQWIQITSWTNSTSVRGTYLDVFSYLYPDIVMVLQADRVITGTIQFNDAILNNSDVGTQVRLQFASQYRSFTISSVESTTLATGTMNDYMPPDLINATNPYSGGFADNFWMGAWSPTNGYPSVVGFDEQRLYWANTVKQPCTLWGSQPADYLNMAPTEEDGTVIATDAINSTIASGDLDQITWIRSGQVLLIGTFAGEYEVTAPGSGAIAPNNISITRQSAYGSLSPTVAFKFGVATLFLQRGGNKLREMLYQFQFNAFNSKDISVISEHIMRIRNGAKTMAYQVDPISVFWIVCNNGDLVSCTYDRDQDIVAFASHTVGGGSSGNLATPSNYTAATVTLTVIPGTQYTLSATGMGWSDSITNGTQTMITSVPVTITAQTSQLVFHSLINGPTASFLWTVNQVSAKAVVESVAVLPNGNRDDVYVSVARFINGNVVRYIEVFSPIFDTQSGDTLTTMAFLDANATYSGTSTSTITGLDYLDGQTVYANVNGTIQGPFTVSGGSITLSSPGTNVIVGVNYQSVFGSLSPEGGSQIGTSQGKRKRISEIIARVKDSLPFKHGANLSQLIQIDAANFGTDLNADGSQGTLKTGDIRFSPDMTWDTQGQYFIVQDQPVALSIDSLMPISVVNE